MSHSPAPTVLKAHPGQFGPQCQNEPIQTPNAVQPSGVLLAACRRRGIVHHASSNAAHYLGTAPQQLLGRALGPLLGQDWSGPVDQDVLARSGAVPAGADGQMLYAHYHLTADSLLVDLEPLQGFNAAPACSMAQLMAWVERLHQARGMQQLFAEAVAALSAITGFDRVLMYVFDPLWHGQVVAERAHPKVAHYLGLRFPNSDIPAQARDLYTRQPLRFVVDADYTPVPLVAQGQPAGALDLSGSWLRSLSPHHQAYMRALKITASFSLSVMLGRRLFGLLSCAHEQGAKAVCPTNRHACQMVAQTLSSLISQQRQQRRRRRQASSRKVVDRLFAQLRSSNDVPHFLCGPKPNMLSLVPATGGVVWQGQRLTTVGAVPPRAVLLELLGWLHRTRGEARVVVCHDVCRQQPQLEPHKGLIGGAMMVRFSKQTQDCVLWCRPAQAQSVAWGGDPNAHLEPSEANAPPRPRSSFARWQQAVHLQSRPFLARDRQAAVQLMDSIIDGVLRHTDRLGRLVQQLQASNEELDAFAYAASHDLGAPLRSIRALAAGDGEAGAGAADGPHAAGEPSDRLAQIRRLGLRMDTLLSTLLHYAQLGRAELSCRHIDPRNLVTQARHVLGERIAAAGAEVGCDPQLPQMWADPVLMGEVFVNLIGNALKYNSAPQPQVHVGSGIDDSGRRYFSVRDNGIGIDPKHHAEVFDIFRRLHPPKAYGGGSGAGLTICQRIVARHQGDMWLRSNPQGGCTFCFCLPSSPAESP